MTELFITIPGVHMTIGIQTDQRTPSEGGWILTDAQAEAMLEAWAQAEVGQTRSFLFSKHGEVFALTAHWVDGDGDQLDLQFWPSSADGFWTDDAPFEFALDAPGAFPAAPGSVIRAITEEGVTGLLGLTSDQDSFPWVPLTPRSEFGTAYYAADGLTLIDVLFDAGKEEKA